MASEVTQRQRAEAAVEPDSIDQSLFVRFEKALDALDRLAREGVGGVVINWPEVSRYLVIMQEWQGPLNPNEAT